MALVRGCHVIAKGDPQLAPGIARKIIQDGGLLVGNAGWGAGAYAYYDNMVLLSRRHEPMVIFDVEDRYVTKRPVPLQNRPDFGFMKMSGTQFAIIPIVIRGFFNLPNFPLYPGPVGFV